MNIWLELFGAVTGIIYLLLEIKKKNAMWIVGMAMSVAYIIIFLVERLYASMGIQVYYLFVSIYGLIQWKKCSTKEQSADSIILKKMKAPEIIISLVVTIGIFFLLWYLLSSFSSDPQPILDAVFSSLSILGTYWLSRSYLPQWVVWIVADAIGIYLFLLQSLYPTSILYLLYTFSAFYGLFYWRKKGIILK